MASAMLAIRSRVAAPVSTSLEGHQTMNRQSVESSAVLVRWASLTALAQGPSASKRHSSPFRSISWPEALKT